MNTQKENIALREENRVLKEIEDQNAQEKMSLQEKIFDLQEENIAFKNIQKESAPATSSLPPSTPQPAASSLPLIATVTLGALAVGY